jgi:hypothetical protein
LISFYSYNNVKAIREVYVPTISIFYGIIIRMFFDDHLPSHFHVTYGEFQAKVSIETLELIDGNLPNRTVALVLEWATHHRKELREDWELCRQKQQPKKILPLE